MSLLFILDLVDLGEDIGNTIFHRKEDSDDT